MKTGLTGMCVTDYEALKSKGMLYEFHPEATGVWGKDCLPLECDSIVETSQVMEVMSYSSILVLELAIGLVEDGVGNEEWTKRKTRLLSLFREMNLAADRVLNE
jgi:hypothetical protein